MDENKYRIEVLKPDGTVAFVRFVKAKSLPAAKDQVWKGLVIRGAKTDRWPESEEAK